MDNNKKANIYTINMLGSSDLQFKDSTIDKLHQNSVVMVKDQAFGSLAFNIFLSWEY
jgi:hypothetical protein